MSISDAERIKALEDELAGVRFAAKQHLTTVNLQTKLLARSTEQAPIQSAGAAELNEPTAELVARLTEYALDNGYCHNDYADTMKQAAACIGQLAGCVELYQRKYAEASAAALAVPATAPTVPAAPSLTDAALLDWLDGEDFVALNCYVQVYGDDGMPLKEGLKFFVVERESDGAAVEGPTVREAIKAAMESLSGEPARKEG